jgi:hypothetical protein
MQRKWNERKFILEKQLHSQLIEEVIISFNFHTFLTIASLKAELNKPQKE